MQFIRFLHKGNQILFLHIFPSLFYTFMHLIKSFVPPALLITAVLGSIFGGIATPTEASGIGAFGAVILALARRKLTFPVFQEPIS